ncbi:hypothetical protein ACFYNO_40550 [Kitasatospora sp. NPDC006697]|uniref:hypothetical protein n=1 Tax=Kitasatospora sp. NPDC006697 TaxID=3364020 RepID=UPI0036B66751
MKLTVRPATTPAAIDLDVTRAALYANGRELHALANGHATVAELDAKLSIMKALHQQAIAALRSAVHHPAPEAGHPPHQPFAA